MICLILLIPFMTQKIEQFLDNIHMQSTLGKLLLPVLFLFLIVMSVIYFSGGGMGVSLPLVIAAMLAFYLAINIGASYNYLRSHHYRSYI